MGNRIRIAELFVTRHALEILMYVYENPMCKKSDIYCHVTRNAHTPEKIALLAERGLLVMDDTDRVTLLSTTEAGDFVAESIMEMDRVVFGDEVADDEGASDGS